MCRALTLTLVFSLSVAAATTDQPKFQTWMEQYKPEGYVSVEETSRREQSFLENVQLVQKMNEEEDGAEYSVFTPYADLTPDEFSKARLMVPRPPVNFTATHPAQMLTSTSADPPSAVDWRDHGAVSEVKDQGSLGTCWAFSTIGNLEGQRVVAKGLKIEDLSVEQLVECDASSDPKNNTADCGEFGGWPYLAYQYFMKAGGVRTDAQMPYCSAVEFGKPGGCIPCMPPGYSKKSCGSYDDDDQIPLFCNKSTTLGQGPAQLCKSTTGFEAGTQVKSWSWLSFDEKQIAASLATNGPLSVALNARKLQFYKKGVFNPKNTGIFGCNPTSLDHGVLIVGYGVDSDSGLDYWTVKNSWGSSWGESGYFRISRGQGTCGINTQVTTAILA